MEVPVTRNDSISFAHVYTLNWDMIPNPRAAIIRYFLIGLFALILIVGGIFGYRSCNADKTPVPQPPVPMAVDSLSQDTTTVPDSVNTQQPDSIANDSLNAPQENAKKKVVKKKEPAKKDSPKEEPEKKDEPTQKKRFH